MCTWGRGGGMALAAHAQQTGKIARIGIVSVGATSFDMVGPKPNHPATQAFLRGLHELGSVFNGQSRAKASRIGQSSLSLPEQCATISVRTRSELTQKVKGCDSGGPFFAGRALLEHPRRD